MSPEVESQSALVARVRNSNDYDIALIVEPEGMVYRLPAGAIATFEFESAYVPEILVDCNFRYIKVYSNGRLQDEASFDALVTVLPVSIGGVMY